MANILIVEDHALSRQMLSGLLKAIGHHVLEAADGAEALSLARAEHPDLIISDILLPGVDGPELVRLLYAENALRDISVIFYTATFRLPETLRLGDMCGTFRVIPKPSEPAYIIQAVNEVLGLDHAGVSSHHSASPSQVIQAKTSSQGAGLQLAAIMDLNISLASERDPERLLGILCKAIREILDCETSLLAVTNDAGSTQYFIGSENSGSTNTCPHRLIPPAEVLERVNAGIPVRTQVASASASGGTGTECKSRLVIPFASPSRVYGWISLTNKLSTHAFTDEDEEMALALSMQAVLVYENILLIEQLRKSDAQYRSLAKNIPSVLVRIDKHMRFMYLNPKAEEITGISATTSVGKTISEAGMPEHLAKLWENAVQEVFCTGNNRDLEFGLPSEGGIKTLYLKLAPEFGLDGTVDHVLTMLADITERKQAEELALASERELLKVTLDSLGEAVVATDQDGRISLINEAALVLTGCSRADVIGKPMHEVIHILDAHKQPLNQTLAPGTTLENSVLIRKDARMIPLTLTHSPLKTIDGRLNGAVTVFQDVTEKKKAEQEHLRAEKLKSIGILAGGIAHDFNNILTAILMNLQLASLKLKSNENIERYLANTIESTRRASDLTKQLLTFSQGGEPVRKDASLVDLIKDTAEFVLSGSKVRAEYQISSDLWAVNIDVGLISQVVHNLVINAKQATPTGGNIIIKAENVVIGDNKQLSPGNYVKVVIKDFGAGIAKENISKIFDPFFTTKKDGNGLGLATSYSIIRKHHGCIEVESQEGIGTTFSFYLPAVNRIVKTARQVSVPTMAENGIRVLLMDDEKRILEAAGEMLQCCGYQVVSALDGVTAINIYKDAKNTGTPFDLVIMDLTVPGGMGGQEAITHLRAFDPDVKAIVSSGYANDPTMAEYEQYGFKGVVTKPYKINELTEVLQRVINKSDPKPAANLNAFRKGEVQSLNLNALSG